MSEGAWTLVIWFGVIVVLVVPVLVMAALACIPPRKRDRR